MCLPPTLLQLRSYKPPLTDKEKAARKAAQKKRKDKKGKVKSEDDDERSGESRRCAVPPM